METSLFCFLCKAPLGNSYNERTTLDNRVVCRTCLEFVRTRTPNQEFPKPSVKEQFYREISLCGTHNKKFKLTCVTCNSLLCSKCVSFHPLHRLDLLSNTLSTIYSKLFNLECSILYTEQSQGSETVLELLIEFLNFYKALEEKPTKEMILACDIQIEEFYSRLQGINKEFVNVPLEKAGDLCRLGRANLLILSYSPRLASIEWGEKSVHLLNHKDLAESTYSLPSNHSALIYCRIAYLPFDQILVCGGRKTAAESSLPDSWILKTHPSLSMRIIEPMLDGRSNHFVLYCNDFVYSIGGLDSRNLYTEKCLRYSLKDQSWEYIADLIEPKDTVGGCCDPINETIFVFGGKSADAIFAIEKFYIRENIWKVLSIVMPWESCISGAFLFPFNQEVIVFGGQDAKSQHSKNVAVVKVESEEILNKGELPYKGGPVTEPPVWWDGKVLALFFEGFVMRKVLIYDCSQSVWEVGLSENNKN